MAKQSRLMIMAQQIADGIIREQTTVRIQMMKDVATITANKVLGLGPGRAEAFLKTYDEVANMVAEMFVEDSADDRQLWYSKAKLDEQLKDIVGEENFQSYEERYGSGVHWGKKDQRIRNDMKEKTNENNA